MTEAVNVEVQLRETVKEVVGLLKEKNFGIGITHDKKFVIIDKESGKYVEIDE